MREEQDECVGAVRCGSALGIRVTGRVVRVTKASYVYMRGSREEEGRTQGKAMQGKASERRGAPPCTPHTRHVGHIV